MSVQLHLGAVAAHHTTLLALLLQLCGLVVVGVLLGLHLGQRGLELLLSGLERSLGGVCVRLAVTCHLGLCATVFVGGQYRVELGLCLVDGRLVVTLRRIHQHLPVDAVLEEQVVREGHVLRAIGDGTGLAQFRAHRQHSHRLVERLQKTMHLQFIQRGTSLALLNIDVDHLCNKVPQVLTFTLILGKECVEEPNSLFLVGFGTQLCELFAVRAGEIVDCLGHGVLVNC
mmetsp:Transcript_13911/g.41901  ORF Transcript_13911/g.41901 Transcript_13911/m.41901 type:complete len:229 (+) Transcript_13911:605-1291(+)